MCKTCGALQPGVQFKLGVQSLARECDCCGLFTTVVKLPASGGDIYNCAPCINPRPSAQALNPGNDHKKPRKFEKSVRVRLPIGLLGALQRDVAPMLSHRKADEERDLQRFAGGRVGSVVRRRRA